MKKAAFYKTPLATAHRGNKILLFSKLKNEVESHLVFNSSSDGLTFNERETELHLFKGKKEIEAQKIISFKIFSPALKTENYTMTFEMANDTGGVCILTAKSSDLKKWQVFGVPLPITFGKQAVFIPKENGRSHNVAYYSDREIWVRTKNGVKNWHNGYIVINPRLDRFDSQPLEALAFIPQEDNLFVIYSSQAFSGNSVDMEIGAFSSSYKDPSKVIWRSGESLWHGHFDKAEYLVPIGGEMMKKHIFLYWLDITGELIVVKLEKDSSDPKAIVKSVFIRGPLTRSERNPIIEPRYDHDWELDGTFNPAAFIDDKGVVHLLYRAIGRDGMSRIGYARSKDGYHFIYRSSTPVYEAPLGYGKSKKRSLMAYYNPQFYTSGGSWGGAEDPRAVKIDGQIYMLYVAFEGWASVRMALTSIALKDLQNGKWNWRKPILISPPGEINKNWLLFPEKVKGKYAILHSIAPKLLIEYVDSLDDLKNNYIRSPRPQGPQPGRSEYWDNLLRGAGPPPLKTELGWLLLYHAIDKRDSGRYKLGAMILDKNNPEKILYRSNLPILSPEMHYENNGKPGIVYASGAVIKNNKLYVYYGGGDRVVCVATAPLHNFLHHVKNNQKPTMQFSRIIIK